MYDRALKLIRQYHRLSQAELADSLNLSRSFVSELENPEEKSLVLMCLNATLIISRSRFPHFCYSRSDPVRLICVRSLEPMPLTRC